MSYKVKNLKKVEDNKVLLDLEITNNYLKKSLNAAYKEISSKAKIPGFRPGKIPYNIIDLNFGKEYVLNEAASIAISELYPQIIEESNIKPIDYPKVKINSIGEDIPLGFEITVEVEPEIIPPKYKDIELIALSEEVVEEEVNKQIDILRNNYATLEAVEVDRPAGKGDFVIVDFVGTIDGKDFEGNSAQDYTLEIGSHTLFKDFENALIGMKKGEHKSIDLVLPDNIANKDLAGKQAHFEIDLKEIKTKVLPELNEDFLSNFGDYKSIEEFKNFISEKLSEQKKKARREKLIKDLLDNLVNNAVFQVPEPMIASRIRLFKEDLDNYLEQNKISKENYLKAFGLDEEKFNQNLREAAVREVKEYLIISAIKRAEAKNIEPTDEQIAQEKEKILNSYQKEEDKKKAQEYLESEDGKRDLIESLRQRNLFDFLIKNARIKEEKSLRKEESLGEVESSEKKLWVPGKTS